MDVSHLSLYQLTLEKGTKLFEDLPHLRESHNNDLMADFYQATTQITKEFGYFQYEISSFSRSREFRSRHNIGYWNGGDYYGVGPGAHGRRFGEDGKRFRTFGVLSPNAWMTSCENEGHGIQRLVEMKKGEISNELILFGLRMNDGILASQFECVTGIQLDHAISISKLRQYIDNGLLTCKSLGGALTTIKCTSPGLLVADRIAADLII